MYIVPFYFEANAVNDQYFALLYSRFARKLNKDIKIYQMTVNPDAFKLDVSEVVK